MAEKDIDRKDDIRENAADIVFESEVKDEEKAQAVKSALEEAEDVLGSAFGSDYEVEAEDIEERLKKKAEERKKDRKVVDQDQKEKMSILQQPRVRNVLFFGLAFLLLIVVAFTAPFSPLKKPAQKPIRVSLVKKAPEPEKKEPKTEEKKKEPPVQKLNSPTPMPEIPKASKTEEPLPSLLEASEKEAPEGPALTALPTPLEEEKEEEVAPPLSEIQKLQEGLQAYRQDLKEIKQTIEQLSQTIGSLSQRTENVERQLEELQRLSRKIGQVQETTEKFGVRLEKLEKQVFANTSQLREIYQQLAKKRKKMRILDPYSVEIEGVVYEIGSVLNIKGKKFVITEIDPKKGVYLVDRDGNKWLLEP